MESQGEWKEVERTLRCAGWHVDIVVASAIVANILHRSGKFGNELDVEGTC